MQVRFFLIKNLQFAFYLPNIHLESCVRKVKLKLNKVRKPNMNSSFVELKCFHPKSNKNRNAIISVKQSIIMTASKFRINKIKMLKFSSTGPTKNLHVKTGVVKLVTRIALQIWATSLFFIDLFYRVIHQKVWLFSLKNRTLNT